VERYAARWSIEVAIEGAKELAGVATPATAPETAVERTIPRWRRAPSRTSGPRSAKCGGYYVPVAAYCC
jgi:hypothetical protein